MNQLALDLSPMTEGEAELCIIFDNGIQHGDCWAGIITCPVVNAPMTFFSWYVTDWCKGEVIQQYTSKRELLDAVQAIAPIGEWRKA